MGCSASRPAAAAAVSPASDDLDNGDSGKLAAPAGLSPPRMRKRSGLAFRYSSESARELLEGQEEEKKKEEREEKDKDNNSPATLSKTPLLPPLTGPLAYHLGKTLGSGGFSVVREAVRLRDGARFAAKVIPMPLEEDEEGPPSFPPASPPPPAKEKKKAKGKGGDQKGGEEETNNAPPPSTRAEVEREVSCLRALPPHPNVVRLVDAFADPAQRAFVVVTELLRGGELQAAQLLAARLRQPQQDGIHRRATQRLLGRPELRIGSTQPQQALPGQTQTGKGRRKRQQGRRPQAGRTDQDHRPLAAALQSGQEQTPLQVHARGLQQLGQRAHRPAAAGQLCVQRRITAGDRVRLRRSQRVRTPDMRGQIGAAGEIG